jgi:hypothetical protein
MSTNTEGVRHLLLAGTEKSGTTSVYLYLNAHPQVAGSVRKETDYFRSPPPHSLADYEALFPGARPGQLRMEASPGYLAESGVAAPAIAALIPDARLLFILRDPIDRLLSGFVFHKSRFHIPEAMSFDDYIAVCMRFERGELGLAEAGLKEWHLRVPDAGRYAQHLRDYYRHFSREQIKVMTLEALQHDPRAFMEEVCAWAGLDAAFYRNFDFIRANVTFSPRRAWMQRLGLRVNTLLEPFFNRYPGVKQTLLGWYKRINGRQEEKPRMSADTAASLVGYYTPDVAELIETVGQDVSAASGWLRKHDVR